MDKLEAIFKKQYDLQTALGVWSKIITQGDKQEYINQTLLAIHEEAVEIMKETNAKNPNFVKFGWKKNTTFNVDKYKEEIIDLVHFVINLCLVVKMTSNEFYSLYVHKRDINVRRRKNGY
jgi:dimeric dUTPase (all-alpha-NTP-PPase superfamily)